MHMMPNDTDSFRGHCASALTHPLTVAAVVVLLLNDALFKSLWPESWVTGKLSDLAWVVFASPLLAFVLSFFVGRLRFTRPAAIIIAYVGLPALYAAFNTFEPVHDRILWGLSLVAGGTAGSPLDPSDSLVIPFGLGIAVWVWRRRPVGPDRLRVRLALLAAGVATFATVATSHSPTSIGITTVGVAGDGAFVAAASNGERIFHYRSGDGGLTWDSHYEKADITWGGKEVETPRGTYLVQDSDVLVLTINGDWKAIYSTEYPRDSASIRLHARSSTLSELRVFGGKPHTITFDPRSRNLIVAMGLQGAVVGNPDGEWSPVAVGPYPPASVFSFAIGNLTLSPIAGLVAIAIALSVSMTAVSIVVSKYRKENLAFGVGVTSAALALLIVLPEILTTTSVHEVGNTILFQFLTTAVIGTGLYLASELRETLATKGLGLALTMYCVIESVPILQSFDASDDLRTNLGYLGMATYVALLALAATRTHLRYLDYRRGALAAFAGMNGLVILVLLISVQLGFGLAFAKFSAFILVALVGLALTAHLKRNQQPS